MSPKFAPIALASIAILMSGCGANPIVKRTNVLVSPPSHPLDELRSVAIEARDEMRVLSKIIEAKNAPSLTPQQHAQKHYQSVVVPAGFDRIDSFSYRGPASSAAQAIAYAAGYQFSTKGDAIPNEPLVNIKTNRLPLNEALRELGVQTGSSIRIEVDGVKKKITLVYLR